MRLPRGVSGDRVIHAPERLGYGVIRQKGSHVRLRHEGPPVHSITVPLHHPFKTGTLSGILSEVAGERSGDSETGGLQIVDALRQMLVGKAVRTLQFHDELFLNHRIGHVFAHVHLTKGKLC